MLAVVARRRARAGGRSARRSGWPRSTSRTRSPTGSGRGSGGTRTGSARASAARRRSGARVAEGDERVDARAARGGHPACRAPRVCHGARQRVPADGEARVADAAAPRSAGRRTCRPSGRRCRPSSALAGAARPARRDGREARGRSALHRHVQTEQRPSRGGVKRLRGARCPRGSRRGRSSTGARAGPARVPQFVHGSWRDHRAVARSDVALDVRDPQPAAAGGEEVELLGLRGGSARRSRRRPAPSPRRGSGCAPASTRGRRSRGSSSRRAS